MSWCRKDDSITWTLTLRKETGGSVNCAEKIEFLYVLKACDKGLVGSNPYPSKIKQ